MKKETWVVVADDAYARIFKVEGQQLKEIETLIHPESRLYEKDLVSDRPGRTFESNTSARRSVGHHIPPKKQEAINFAKSVAAYLDSAVLSGGVARLYLAACPSFLGLLRQSLSKHTSELIIHEIDKEITHLNPAEICAFFTFVH